MDEADEDGEVVGDEADEDEDSMSCWVSGRLSYCFELTELIVV